MPGRLDATAPRFPALNESPSEKEGKLRPAAEHAAEIAALNESPSEKEGKLRPIFSVACSSG